MCKIYFKQALEMLKQNKFISIITIMGTALAIMMIMVILVTDSIKKISVAPEVNRNRMMYLKHEIKKSKDEKSTSSNSVISFDVYKSCLRDLKTPEMISLQFDEDNKAQVSTAENTRDISSMNLKLIDSNFWKIMQFSFLKGSPISEEEFKSGIKKTIITENTAKKLFGNDDVIGKTININFETYTIAGVIKDVSPVFNFAHSDIYIPLTSASNYENKGYRILFLAKDRSYFDAITEEIRLAERKFNSADAEWNLTLLGPYDQSTQILNNTNVAPNVKGYKRRMIFIFAVLLLVPAINLSSISFSRIRKRIEEIGIRKAFGARKYTILIQILYENLITSLIGGFIGLLLSYGIVIWLKKWLLGLDTGGEIPIETFISVPVFIGVFVASVLLNLLSAGIPAYRASKIKIIASLNKNQES